MSWFLVLLAVAVISWKLIPDKKPTGRRQSAGVDKPIHGQPVGEAVSQPSSPIQAIDLQDSTIGNPRNKMKALSLNQILVLSEAAGGAVIYYAEPGHAHSGISGVNYFHQKPTIDALARAEFLLAQPNGGFVITKLGMKALQVLPEKSN